MKESSMDSFYHATLYNRVPTLLEEKNPGVFQSNFRIFQVLLVIVRSQNI